MQEEKSELGHFVIEKGMPPSAGDIVLYRVGEFDSPEMRHNHTEDLYLPAIIVRVWSDTCLNLKVFTDGPVDVWKTSVVMGDRPGEWQLPPGNTTIVG